jgi:hypothetical protein
LATEQASFKANVTKELTAVLKVVTKNEAHLATIAKNKTIRIVAKRGDKLVKMIIHK